MRLVTWNCCRGQYSRKVPLLDALKPDIAVIQECALPEATTDQCLWFGDNPKQGVAVIARGDYRLKALPLLPDTPKHIYPVHVTGPQDFLLFAVWTHGKQEFRYVEAAARAVDMYLDDIVATPTCLVGDFNSNVIWDATHPADLNHSALVARLSALGIVSAYHHHTGERPGQERQPTYFFHWSEEKPYHIDYCFVPEAWASKIQNVEIGTYDAWKAYSDHRPLLVVFSEN